MSVTLIQWPVMNMVYVSIKTVDTLAIVTRAVSMDHCGWEPGVRQVKTFNTLVV